MQFIDPTLPVFIKHLSQLDKNKVALWGRMSIQRMIEHLSDSLHLSVNDHKYTLTIPEDKVQKAQDFLFSEHPMPKNFNVEFATPEMTLRNKSLNSAIEEFKEAWILFENYFNEDKNRRTLHPNFGRLNYEQWLRLHSKHFTHHLQQFGV